ncbi:CDK-activating kinase assembly factor MAT1 [Apis mellifera caucasica]|uniref:CDK-activating kinase assembly factor MAT1 n=1 Tax=Apis mellifera TaxID=7460 RepID=A0A7M7IL92_APIME|nr:CDK-activating kinase assembly factor MAT1 [Apis mellifera]KAG6797680.1 CDK-activating kinase assembly factor MAT1 [Apis mellifera caucasica]KAG9437531.1 CDK-activating kinase assembly factor MAT1 [Apis mellifera carnica]|eukprot:XP_016773404.1 CDK-activating kinase assembly factor MAT1 [Apis mellifera]
MDDQACPRCKTTKYRNPSLKMMVNVCGHTLCESCVNLLFLKGSGSCPECKIPLRRANFRVQLFEDPMVEKEVNIRKRILRDFNKKEEDFATLREYNDYLEEIETLIYNLANNIDVIETNKKIEQYKKDNKDQITKSKSKLGRSEYELEEMIELEKQKEEERRLEIAKEEMEAKRKKIREKEALIDELTFSEGNAKNIVETFASVIQASRKETKAAPAKATQFSTGIKFSNQGGQNYLPIPKIEEGPLYTYTPIKQITDGPAPPSWRELQARGYVSHVRAESAAERAGGFKAHVACLRALQESMAGLYYNPSQRQTEFTSV